MMPVLQACSSVGLAIAALAIAYFTGQRRGIKKLMREIRTARCAGQFLDTCHRPDPATFQLN